MRHLLLGAAAATALAVGSVGAMAQTVAPVPNASGSQTTDPATKGSTANEYLGRQDTGSGSSGIVMVPGSAAQLSTPPVPNASGSQTTNPAAIGSTANEWLNRQDTGGINTTGSIAPMPGASSVPAAPVPNASGSQTTNPAAVGSSASQQLQR